MFSSRNPSTSDDQFCSVCMDKAEGYHFGAVSCAACGAFFRRSVSDQKVYSCSTRQCHVRYEHHRRGGACRFCRFAKCIAAGMMPQEVRAKRSTQFSKCSIRVLPPSFGRKAVGNSVVETMIGLRREISIRRMNTQERRGKASFNTWKQSLEEEFIVFRQLVATCPLVSTLISDDIEVAMRMSQEMTHWDQLDGNSPIRDLFLTFYLMEMVWATLAGGGVQLDRLYLPDGTHTDFSEIALMAFFRDNDSIRHPQLSAVLNTSKFFARVVQSLTRTLQAAHIDETEGALVFYLTLHQIGLKKH
uniref:Nuclear receptor domain-containing protein n=1 Tax=Heterorhabditis bacteriophora TaxID=37862 RepID=A0A1I7XBK7_HETBA